MKKNIALSTAVGLISAVAMLLLSVLSKFGLYKQAVNMMEQWHMFYSLSIIGVLTGMIEAFIISFIFVYGTMIVYDKMV